MPNTTQVESNNSAGNEYWVGLVVCGLAVAVSLGLLVPNQMWPHDEGQYGQTAMRILDGELPHRDFQEMYTGLLSYWNAFVFWLWGSSLLNLRYALVLVATLAGLCGYEICFRMTKRVWLSVVIAVAALITSVGMSHAPSPTIYLSLFTWIALWSVFRFIEKPGWQYVLLSGVIAGVAIGFKVTGLYLVAALGLAWTYVSFESSSEQDTDNEEIDWLSRSWKILLAVVGAASAIALVFNSGSGDSFAYLALPVVLSVILLPLSETRLSWRKLGIRYGVFASGVALPILLLMMPWLTQGATEDLYRGVFVLPRLRLEGTASFSAPSYWGVLCAVPALACCLPGQRDYQKWGRAIALLVSIAILIFGFISEPVSRFQSTAMLAAIAFWRWIPVLAAAVIVGATFIFKSTNKKTQAMVFAVLITTVFNGLNQFPFVHPVYFFFGAGNIALLAIACSCVANREGRPQPVDYTSANFAAAAVVCCFAMFCLLRFGVDGIFAEFASSVRRPGNLERFSGLNVPKGVGEPYLNLEQHVLQNTSQSNDSPIFAGPDCPEVYFLLGRKNPTPIIYEMFETRDDLEGYIFEQAKNVEFIIINHRPEFSGNYSPELIEKLRSLDANYASGDYEEIRFGKFELIQNQKSE